MIGKILDNRYELVEFVGKGGMALVYKARDKRTNHFVAVKILRPEFNHDAEFLTRFDREAVAASKMSHHNIVNLLDVGLDGDCRYLIMEYVEGRTLKDIIQERGPLPPTVAAQIAIRVLSALQHAHKNGIIHRDIKPQNILVHSEGIIKVADFGIARVAGSNTISKEDLVMGSVHYFSPEQARGEDVTYASDIYSVGVLLYEMLTGYVPFDGDTPVAVALQHISAEPKPMSELKPDVPKSMELIVTKAMQKRPEDRYQSALEMAQNLHRALHEPAGDWLNAAEDKPIPSIALVQPQKKRNIKKRKKRFLIRCLLAAGALLALFALAQGVFTVYRQIVNSTTAPYVLGETEETAVRLIEHSGLAAEISRTSDSTKPAGTVILQSPEFDAQMKKGETLFITVSTGPEEQTVPDVVDKSLEQATAELEKMGFILLAMPERELSDRPWSTVLSQKPVAGEMLSVGGIVQVVLSGGSVQIPNLVGMMREEALLLCQQLGLNITEIREVPINDEAQFDRVAAQQFTTEDSIGHEPGDFVIEGTTGTLAIYVQAQTEEPSAEETGEPAEEEPEKSETSAVIVQQPLEEVTEP